MAGEEFAWIKNHFSPLAGGHDDSHALKDDAFIGDIPVGHRLVITKDLLVAGTHFFPDDDAFLLAKKALRVNLSDLFAKGATPWGYFMGVTFPKKGSPVITESWIQSFCAGLAEDQSLFNIRLMGGDTTTGGGTLVISVTALGLFPTTVQPVRRTGAKVGDGIWVTGHLGESALGLKCILNDWPSGANLTSKQMHALKQAYYCPEPYQQASVLVQDYANSSMDISDGLVQDLEHICTNSNVGAVVDWCSVPLPKPLYDKDHAFFEDHNLLQDIVAGGDDYQVLMTISPEKEAMAKQHAEKLNIPLTRIGVITQGLPVVYLQGRDNQEIKLAQKGYIHGKAS